MGKSAAVDVLEHFNSCVESIEKNEILQVFSDGPINVNLSFLKILDEHKRVTELNPLIDIGTCGLYTEHNLFDESSSRRADYERITSASKSDFPLRSGSHG